MAIEHKCDSKACRTESEYCYCDGCLESIKQASYDEGYKDGARDAREDIEVI